MEPINNQTNQLVPNQPNVPPVSQDPQLNNVVKKQGPGKKYMLYGVLVVLALVILVVIAGYFLSSQKSTNTTVVPTQAPVAQTGEEVADITDESELDSLNDELATDDGTLTNELNALEGESNF